MRYHGRLTKWDDGKGFGFVVANGGGDQAFVHIKAFGGNASRRPVEGDLITYEVTSDSQKRLRAEKVRFADTKPAATPAVADMRRTWGAEAVFVGICFGALLMMMAMGFVEVPVILMFAVASPFTFIVYAFDKSAAMNDRWRTPENTLHILSLFGGWPGAFLAQRFLRHKSSKRAFRQIYWVTVCANLGGVAWLASAKGSAFFDGVMRAL